MTSQATVDVLAQFTTLNFRRDPYPFLKWLRENDPVHLTSKGFYLISRHADAEWVLRDSEDALRTPDRDRLTQQFPEALGYRSVRLLLNSLPSLNGHAHTRIRKLVARDFTPKRVAAMYEYIGQTCDRLLDGIADQLHAGDVVDLHVTWTKPLALDVISDLLGVPPDVRGSLATDASELAAALGTGSAPLLGKADEHTRPLEDYFRMLIGQRRRDPRADLLSALARERDGPGADNLSDEELIAMSWILWNVGFEGTAAAIEHGVRLMTENPDQREYLRGDLGPATAFADEALRHTGPQIFLGVSQIPVRDIELSGVRIPAGAQVRPVLAAANRDPEVFENPDRFDPARDTSAALVFGTGTHHCLGAFLARAEIAIALARLHQRFQALVMAGEPTWRQSLTLRHASSFPVRLASPLSRTI